MAAATRRRRILKAAAGAAAALLLIVALAVALAPRWINVAAVRARVESAASGALGGVLRYDRVDLTWFPRPVAVIHQARVSVPGTVHGAVRSVRVAFAFLPLLRGKFVPSRIAVDGLDLFLSRPDGRGLWLEGVRADASGGFLEGRRDVSVQLSAASPKLDLKGVFRPDDGARRVELTARGSLDGGAVREALLAFAGDDRTIAEIFSIFRGGKLTTFTFDSAGPTGDLFALERMKIRGRVEDASLRIEGPGLDLADVSADVVLEGSVLSAEGAEARLGGSSATDGRVLVGLAKGDGRLHIEARVEADLAEAPAVLARAVPSLREELAHVSGVQGHARGTLKIGECSGALEPTIALDEMRLSGRHAFLPWPIAVREGRFALEGPRITLSRFSGSVGRSAFSGVEARLRLGKESRVEAASGAIDVELGDFFDGARASPGMAGLVKDVRLLSGTARIEIVRLAGPLARLGEARLDASGTFKGILFEFSSLPPISIASGRFGVSDDEIRVDEADAKLLDAPVRVSGAWRLWRGDAWRIEAAADGEAGPQAVRWTWERASLPAQVRPAAPLAIRNARLAFAPGGAVTLAGSFGGAGGPAATLDLEAGAGRTNLRDLTIVDGDSRASIAVHPRGESVEIVFRGRLGARALAKLLEEPPWRRGVIEGDVRALVNTARPALTTADGRFAVSDAEIPGAADLSLERLDARAEGHRLDVASSSFAIGGERFAAEGSATAREGAVFLDLRSLAWRDYVFRPVVADVRFGRDGVSASVRRAATCGISLSGSARLLPRGGVAIDAQVESAGPDVSVPVTCLGIEDFRATGRYEAHASLKAEGEPAWLPFLLRGPVSFRAEQGRIGKATMLTQVLSVLNATDVFAGKNRTRVGEAMPYEAIELEADLANGSLAVCEASLVAPSLTMGASGDVGLVDRSLDLMVLAHPLSGFDKAVRAVPVVREVFKGDLTAVAVHVTGTFDAPRMRVTPARDVGRGVIGILERTVKLPVTVFEPPGGTGR